MAWSYRQDEADAFLLDSVLRRGLDKVVHVAIRSDGEVGLGTPEDPFDGSTQAKFDALMTLFGTYSTINLGKGTFQTNVATGVGTGFYTKTGWNVKGEGRYRTVVQMIGDMTGNHADVEAFKTNGTVDNVKISDLTVDCNSAVITPTADTGSGGQKLYKSGGIILAGNNCQIDNVHVKNAYGSTANGTESFSIMITGGTNGKITNCHVDGFAGSYGAPYQLSSMTNSRVEGNSAVGNDTGTDVGFNTGGVAAGDLIDCQITDNNFIDCNAVFRNDTGTCTRVLIARNSGVRCGMALWVGNGGANTDVRILDNFLHCQNRNTTNSENVNGIVAYSGSATRFTIARNEIRYVSTGSGPNVFNPLNLSSLAGAIILDNISDQAAGVGGTCTATGTNVIASGNRTTAGALLTNLPDTGTDSGWTAWTGSGSKSTKTVSGATTAEVAAAMKAIIDALIAKGILTS